MRSKSDVYKRQVHDHALEAQTIACVLHAAELAEVQVPVVAGLVQTQLVHTGQDVYKRQVCTLRHIPIFTFINKMDREARDPFELMENLSLIHI